jgi:hypothetical protein
MLVTLKECESVPVPSRLELSAQLLRVSDSLKLGGSIETGCSCPDYIQICAVSCLHCPWSLTETSIGLIRILEWNKLTLFSNVFVFMTARSFSSQMLVHFIQERADPL